MCVCDAIISIIRDNNVYFRVFGEKNTQADCYYDNIRSINVMQPSGTIDKQNDRKKTRCVLPRSDAKTAFGVTKMVKKNYTHAYDIVHCFVTIYLCKKNTCNTHEKS